MPFTFHPADESSARIFLHWQYPPPYDIYNVNLAQIEAAVQFVLDPQNAYYSIYDSSHAEAELLAFCCFGADARVPGGDYSKPALDIGLGLRPDLTGHGRGIDFVTAILQFAQDSLQTTAFRVTTAAFRVTIAGFNLRAQRVWEKAGFQPAGAFSRNRDGKPFVILIQDPDHNG